MNKVLSALLPLVLAVPSTAQSINIDFGTASAPSGQPTPNYAGSAGAPGVWNVVNTLSFSGLRRWDDLPTGVSVSLNDPDGGCVFGDPAPYSSFDVPNTSGENEALIDDWYSPVAFSITCTIQGLAPGDYSVDTILSHGLCPAGTDVSVQGSPDPVRYVSGNWSGSFVEGESFARHRVTVTNGTIRVDIVVLSLSAYIFLSGIQLNMEEQELPGVPLCFGDGSAAACPCANTGGASRGCQNSASTGGAVLFATGTANPDTVVLRSSGELPNALSIFLQGNASITPVVYGDGLRCAGGALRRLYTKSASGGEVFAPGPGDPSITVRSAQVGVPIPPEGRRYYQVYYRDANPGFCAAPSGNTFNISSAVKIDW